MLGLVHVAVPDPRDRLDRVRTPPAYGTNGSGTAPTSPRSRIATFPQHLVGSPVMRFPSDRDSGTAGCTETSGGSGIHRSATALSTIQKSGRDPSSKRGLFPRYHRGGRAAKKPGERGVDSRDERTVQSASASGRSSRRPMRSVPPVGGGKVRKETTGIRCSPRHCKRIDMFRNLP